MPELRRDSISGDEVLYAPRRGMRPNAHGSATQDGPCPFCPGNEAQTPAEIDALREAGSKADGPGWRVRVFPNRFPAVEPPLGRHEVIVDTTAHAVEFSNDSLRMYRSRLAHHAADPANRYVVLFKNSGPRSGQSIHHPHAQLVALSFEPVRSVASAAGAQRYFDAFGRCAICDECTAAGGETLVRDNGLLSVYSRPPARFAEEFRIAPKAHAPFFGDAADEDVDALYAILADLVRALREMHDELSYTLIFAPGLRPGSTAAAAIHWYVDLIVRTSHFGGLELASGMTVNSGDPKESAERLRHKVSSHDV